MNDNELDDFEAVLKALAPLPASTELRDRVKREVEAENALPTIPRVPTRGLASPLWMTVAAAMLVAIGIGLWHRFSRDHNGFPRPDSEIVVEPSETPQETGNDSPPPTLWAYRLAAVDSPRQLDRLLDQHARTLLPRDDDLLSAREQIP